MAFFNLTHLGVQDPIKSSLKEDKENDYKVSKNEQQQQHQNYEQKPQNNETAEVTTSKCSSSVNRNTEAQGSYVKYTERLTRHQRTQNGTYNFIFI